MVSQRYEFYFGVAITILSMFISVVAKELGCRLKIKLRQLKYGAKPLILSAEVPVALYRVIAGQKSSWRMPLFQSANFTGS